HSKLDGRSISLISITVYLMFFFFFSSRRRHTRLQGDWSSDVCSSDLVFSRVEVCGRARKPLFGGGSSSSLGQTGALLARLPPKTIPEEHSPDARASPVAVSGAAHAVP